jgi:hypothetical protein
MHPNKVNRNRLNHLKDLPNIGPAMAADLATLGIQSPADLVGRSAFEMYAQLCDVTGVQHDPCVIDVFMSVIDYMAGNEAKPWWDFTPERKRILQQQGVTPDA